MAVRPKARPKSRSSHIPHVTKTRGAIKEANARFARDDAIKRRSPNLLTPSDLRGNYDASRVLMTTLGGEIRPLSDDDLAAFRDNVATVARHYTKGLTAQKIINLSRDADRERANQQIHYAIPSSANRGTIRFITNASEESDVKRHYTIVKIMDFVSQASQPGEPKSIASKMQRSSPLQVWCDCGSWRFFYAYVATIGGVNAGPPETIYPKIRNPLLTGLGCKHILRTLTEFQRSSSIREVIARMVSRNQHEHPRQNEVISTEAARDIANRQRKAAREVEVRLPGPKAEWDPLRARVKKKWTAEKEKQPTKTADKARADALKNLRKLKDLGQLSEADYNKILTTLKK